MKHPTLEEEIRSLRPAPLPPDLLSRMAQPPPVIKQRRTRRVLHVVFGAGLAVAAALAIMARWPAPPPPPAAAPPSLTISQHRSVLLDARTLAVLHHDGRTWEVAEQRWRDDNLALCSAVPQQVRSSAIRREIVCQPVDFY
jgi:hypothetical protein